jgi:hypothetical protein
MLFRSPLNRVNLNNLLRGKFIYYYCTADAYRRFTGVIKEGKMRILVVEDDKMIGDGLKAGLSKMGFSIDWFTDTGRESGEVARAAGRS